MEVPEVDMFRLCPGARRAAEGRPEGGSQPVDRYARETAFHGLSYGVVSEYPRAYHKLPLRRQDALRQSTRRFTTRLAPWNASASLWRLFARFGFFPIFLPSHADPSTDQTSGL